MASKILLLAVIGVIGLVNCQRDRERDRDSRDRIAFSRPAEGCSGKVMDVFFVFDSSSSIYINDYRSHHRIVRDIVSRFDVSEESTRVGMLTFSDDIQRPVIGLSTYQTKSELLNAISTQNLPYRTGVTNTDLAIRYVRQLNDFRQDITKVMVVITDGGSRSPGSTSREADLARNSGFYLFVVGGGQYIEEREWRAIANDPDDNFIYNTTNARLIDEVKYSLPPRACALPPIVRGGSCDIQRPSELYFVSGRSTSDQAQTLIESFIRRTRDPRDILRISYFLDGCRSLPGVGLVENEPFFCDRYDPQTGTIIAPEGAADQFSNAFRALQESRRNSRSNNRVIVLFADDESMSSARFDLSSTAENAKSFGGATVVVVDLGMRTYREFSQGIASDRSVVSFLGGSVAGQPRSERRMLDTICAALNDAGFNPNGIAN